MPNTTGRFHLYSDNGKFATGSGMIPNTEWQTPNLCMPAEDYQKLQEIIPLQS